MTKQRIPGFHVCPGLTVSPFPGEMAAEAWGGGGTQEATGDPVEELSLYLLIHSSTHALTPRSACLWQMQH